MKNIRLENLVLKFFKGIKYFELAASGCNTDVLGDNATGKTTIMDAVLWLLFDKNSENKADFGVKTRDKCGNELHKLEHAVEAVFKIESIGDDGLSEVRILKLRKVFKEKWTKPRGRLVEEFSGHTVDYFVNEVPVKAGEYKKAVGELVDESLFRLLTNPLHFNNALKWQERRKIVLEVAGDITEDTVLGSKPEFAPLVEELKGNSIEDFKKIAKAKLTGINKEIEGIPVRISELSNLSTDDTQVDVEKAKDYIATIDYQIQDRTEKIAVIKASDPAVERKNKISELEQRYKDIEFAENDRIRKANAVVNDKIDEAKRLQQQCGLSVSRIKYEINQLETSVKNCDEKRVQLIAEFTREKARVSGLPDEVEGVCPTCGSVLPVEKLAEAKSELVRQQAEFNESKAKRLEEINAKGKDNNETKQRYLDDIENKRKELSEFEKTESDLGVGIAKLQNSFEPAAPSVEVSQELEDIKRQIEQFSSCADAGVDTKVQSIQAEIEDLRRQQNDLRNLLAEALAAKNSQKRIDELNEREQVLAKEHGRLSELVFLCEEFTRVKVAMLEEQINSKFSVARFRLFESNLTNDGITECCDTVFEGVPFNDLNNAARINVGLDIIKTLANHYGVCAPVFVDNAEAVTRLLDLDFIQVIRLVVSAEHKELSVEI